MRKVKLVVGEHYHIFNRGVDKRDIFLSSDDFARFFQSMDEFNSVQPIGSLFENSFNKNQLGDLDSKREKLVNFVCYCLNKNHYHFILEQIADNGIEKFMHRMLGYTMFFNKKYGRTGSLFQGPFKAVHIETNAQLLHTSVYVNLNNKVHGLGDLDSKSSWGEYIGKGKNNFCEKDIILGQGLNYKNYAKVALKEIKDNKEVGNSYLET